MAKIDWSTVEIEGNVSEGIRAVFVGGKWGHIDVHDEIVTEPKYIFAGPFSEGMAWVEGVEDGYGFVDKTGTEVIPATFHFASNFHEGRALVIDKANKFGFIDKAGHMVIPATFDHAQRFEDGKAEVEKDFEVFFIDRDGNRIEE